MLRHACSTTFNSSSDCTTFYCVVFKGDGPGNRSFHGYVGANHRKGCVYCEQILPYIEGRSIPAVAWTLEKYSDSIEPSSVTTRDFRKYKADCNKWNREYMRSDRGATERDQACTATAKETGVRYNVFLELLFSSFDPTK